MKRELMKKMMLYFCLPAAVLTGLLVSCSDDPESINEEEVITKMIVTLSPEPGATGDDVILSWTDTNLNSIVEDDELSPTAVLEADKIYIATIELLNESADPDINVSEEVEEEAEDHIFCFTATNGVIAEFDPLDKDGNDLDLGLRSTWTTSTTAGEGTVNIKLRHQPGFKTGDCPLPGDPAPGETDIDITFNVEVELESPI